MPKTIGVGTVTLTDLTDAIVANTEPDIKEVGTLWIDSTGGNNILKEWNGSRWVTVTLDVSSLDPDLAEKVTSMERKLGNIGTDGELDYEDRVLLTEFLSQIVGEALSTSNTIKYGNSLPDYTVLDSQGRGSFASYRSNALSAGVGEDSTEYLDLQHAYTDMNNYLSRYTPKPWDIRTSQKNKIIDIGTGDVLRQKLLDYYLAELTLVTTTTEVANEKLADVSLKDKGKVSGKELYTDKADNSVVHAEIDGKSYQHSGSGKNLMPDLKFIAGDDAGQRKDTQQHLYITLKEGTYTYSNNYHTSFNTWIKNPDSSIHTSGGGALKITTTEEATYAIVVNTVDSKDPKHYKIQIEEGSTATEYELPAPAPDYPIEIHSVNDFDVVSSVGKRNLIRRGGEVIGYHTASGTTGYHERLRISEHLIDVEPNTDYIASNSSDLDEVWRLSWLNKDEQQIQFSQKDSGSTSFNPIFKSPNNAEKLRISYPDAKEVKLEKGTKATDWTPAPEDITEDSNHPLIDKINLSLSEPLRSVGDVKDRLFKDSDGMWKVERNVGEDVVDGNRDWYWHNSLSNEKKDVYEISGYTVGRDVDKRVVTNQFSYTLYTRTEVNHIYMSQWLKFGVKKGHFEDTSKLSGRTPSQAVKDHFNEVPLVIQYILKNPTIETLDQELQDKLNNLRSFQDSNYVYTTFSTDTPFKEELAPTLRATFKSKGWYKQFTTDKDIMDSDASGGSALHSTRLPQPIQIPELSNNSRNAFTLEVLVYALAEGPYTILQRENGDPVLSLTETSDGLGVTWGDTTFSNPDAIPYGAWSRISLTTNDVGGGNFSLYVDGNFMSGITISLPTNLNNLYISPDFDGYIADLRLWNVGMSDIEIHEIANHSLEGNEDRLVYNYKLNGGTRLYDTGPYANHIEIRNGEIPWVHESIALKDIQDSEQKKRDEALGGMQDSLITTFETGQVNTSDSLTQYVNQIKTDLDGKIQETQSTFNTLNSDGFSVGLGDVRALSEANQDSIDKLEAVFNMNPKTQVLTIGAPSSQYRLELSPEKMVFKDGTADVAEISNQQLKINKGIFVQSLQVGEHAFTQYADGITTIAWTGK